ncbi:lipid-A-disaccharide synthase, partial [Candidatus Sumerlaeota bacterium]|nr:lipid-A-disaccharide synthase [Candidatus Sumerlaeota bacterium]
LVIFPFEEKFLREAGVQVEYVGHPLLDVMILTMSREEVFTKFEFDPAKKLIGLLPGSRKREIDTLLPVMLEAAEMIQARMPETQFVIPRASSIRIEHINKYLGRANVAVKIVDSFRYNVRSTMDFAMVASGTATLETGLLLCPMVILYRVPYPTWFLAKLLVNIPYIGLINIVAGDMVVPELLQDQCTAQNVSDRVLKVLHDGEEIKRIKYQLARVKEKMGAGGASRRAAQTILSFIPSPSPGGTEPS